MGIQGTVSAGCLGRFPKEDLGSTEDIFLLVLPGVPDSAQPLDIQLQAPVSGILMQPRTGHRETDSKAKAGPNWSVCTCTHVWLSQ